MDVSPSALYGTVLTARRWYERTGWQKCLPDSDADRLMACMVRQHPIGKSENHMEVMHRVISDWAKRSMEKKRDADGVVTQN